MSNKVSFEGKMILVAKRYHLNLGWQSLKFGFKRAVIKCDSREEMEAVLSIVNKLRNSYVDKWVCSAGGVFEGIVYVMDRESKTELNLLLEEEQNRVEDWWRRYHNANEEVRRLMACGAID